MTTAQGPNRRLSNKQALFEATLRRYLDEFMSRLSAVLQTGGSLDAVADFFAAMAQAFRADPAGNARGCLLVNTVANWARQTRCPPAWGQPIATACAEPSPTH